MTDTAVEQTTPLSLAEYIQQVKQQIESAEALLVHCTSREEYNGLKLKIERNKQALERVENRSGFWGDAISPETEATLVFLLERVYVPLLRSTQYLQLQIDDHDARLDDHDARLDDHDGRLDALRSDHSALRSTVERLMEGVPSYFGLAAVIFGVIVGFIFSAHNFAQKITFKGVTTETSPPANSWWAAAIVGVLAMALVLLAAHYYVKRQNLKKLRSSRSASQDRRPVRTRTSRNVSPFQPGPVLRTARPGPSATGNSSTTTAQTPAVPASSDATANAAATSS